MYNPNIGTLLRGLRAELSNTVLPELSSGVAQRQLKAGIHLLGRLERTWDLTQGYLNEDNADIESSLKNVCDKLPELKKLIHEYNEELSPAQSVDGVNDPDLQLIAQRNKHLHEQLEKVQNYLFTENTTDRDAVEVKNVLRGLCRRMAKRDSLFVGNRE